MPAMRPAPLKGFGISSVPPILVGAGGWLGRLAAVCLAGAVLAGTLAFTFAPGGSFSRGQGSPARAAHQPIGRPDGGFPEVTLSWDPPASNGGAGIIYYDVLEGTSLLQKVPASDTSDTVAVTGMAPFTPSGERGKRLRTAGPGGDGDVSGVADDQFRAAGQPAGERALHGVGYGDVGAGGDVQLGYPGRVRGVRRCDRVTTVTVSIYTIVCRAGRERPTGRRPASIQQSFRVGSGHAGG